LSKKGNAADGRHDGRVQSGDFQNLAGSNPSGIEEHGIDHDLQRAVFKSLPPPEGKSLKPAFFIIVVRHTQAIAPEVRELPDKLNPKDDQGLVRNRTCGRKPIPAGAENAPGMAPTKNRYPDPPASRGCKQNNTRPWRRLIKVQSAGSYTIHSKIILPAKQRRTMVSASGTEKAVCGQRTVHRPGHQFIEVSLHHLVEANGSA